MLLRYRSYQKELLDAPSIPKDDLFRNLKELDTINTLLGGYDVSKRGLNKILKSHPDSKALLDVGFGGGDSIKQLARHVNKRKIFLQFFGADLKQDCVDYAEKNLQDLSNVSLFCKDVRSLNPTLLEKVDIVHCSLFLHHLTEEEIIDLFKFCKRNNCMILGNDLHRHPLAFWSIRLLTLLFSKSYLVKNDAPLSVKRGFKKHELESLLRKAGYTDYSVTWSWAFRFIIIARS